MATIQFDPTKPIFTDSDDAKFQLLSVGLVMHDSYDGEATIILLKEDLKAFSDWLNTQLEN